MSKSEASPTHRPRRRRPGERRLAAALLATLLLLTASTAAANTDEDTDAFVRRCLGLIADGELERANGCFALGVLGEANADLLDRAHQALQLGGTLEFELIEPKLAIVGGDERIDQWMYHVRGSEHAGLWTASIRQTPTGPALLGLGWEEAPFDLGDRFPFTLMGMPWFAYVSLALAVVIPLFMVQSAVICFRRQPSFLWLWMAFILVGVGRLSVVWRPDVDLSSGVFFAPVTISILGVGMSKWPAYNPWVLWVSFPLGALVFRWWTRNWDAPYVDPGTPPPAGRPDA